MTYRTPALCFALLMIGLVGCDAFNTDGIEDEDVAGAYEAATFVVATIDTSYDVLGAGGILRMTLEEDETVTGGQLVIPCSLPTACEPGEEGEASEASFEGTYDVSGNVVIFNHDADTFIRNVQWVYQADTLYAEFPASDSMVVGVALARQ